jgi:hypothetical protein
VRDVLERRLPQALQVSSDLVHETLATSASQLALLHRWVRRPQSVLAVNLDEAVFDHAEQAAIDFEGIRYFDSMIMRFSRWYAREITLPFQLEEDLYDTESPQPCPWLGELFASHAAARDASDGCLYAVLETLTGAIDLRARVQDVFDAHTGESDGSNDGAVFMDEIMCAAGLAGCCVLLLLPETGSWVLAWRPGAVRCVAFVGQSKTSHSWTLRVVTKQRADGTRRLAFHIWELLKPLETTGRDNS